MPWVVSFNQQVTINNHLSSYYEKSLQLAGELENHVSVGWAHGNLLGLDQKDKALDHLITAFHTSARYEGNPLAVGRAVSKTHIKPLVTYQRQKKTMRLF